MANPITKILQDTQSKLGELLSQGKQSEGEAVSPGGPVGPASNIIDQGKKNDNYKDLFWQQATVDAEKWSKVFPYQFRILRAQKGGGYTTVDTFTLPLTPQQLSITMPFAIETKVTLRGIVEEHGGAPLHQISFSGTTGVYPYRSSTDRPQSPNFLGSIFAGTVTASTSLISQINTLVNGNNDKSNLEVPKEADGTNPGLRGTGYYQFHLLHKFLEKYALQKRGASYIPSDSSIEKPEELRLAFCMWKDDWIFLITPKQFTLSRSAQNPFLYNYAFAGLAWKRIPSLGTESANGINYQSLQDRPNGFQRLLKNIQSARRTLQATTNLLGAIRADINTSIFEPIRQTILFAKDTVGAGITLIDMPNAVVNDFQHTVVRSWDTVRDNISDSLNRRTPSPGKSQPVANLVEKELQKATQNKDIVKPLNSATPLNKVFANPIKNLEFFDAIELGTLPAIPLEIQNRVEDERATVAALSRKDFEASRAKLLSASTDIANNLGLGGETYNRLIGRDGLGSASNDTAPLPSPPFILNPDRLEPLYALQEAIIEFDKLVASRAVEESKTLDKFQYLDSLTQNAQIPFEVPAGKFIVPVPFGLTVEAISNLYLGTPDRWLEIATLNNLKAPYIDEEGFSYPLIANGGNGRLAIASKENLYIGQKIEMSSITVPSFFGRILNIETITNEYFLLTVQSNTDLAILSTANSAKLKAYLPNTLNSLNLMFIPSAVAAQENDLKLRRTPSIDDIGSLVETSGVDLLLDGSGDLAIGSDGEIRLAIGLSNLIQAAKLKLDTAKAALMRHPSYGSSIQIGAASSDISFGDIVKSIQASFDSDDRFTGVDSIQINQQGPALVISLLVGIQGMDTLIPISVKIQN